MLNDNSRIIKFDDTAVLAKMNCLSKITVREAIGNLEFQQRERLLDSCSLENAN